jgi:hypothetical protein
MPAARAAEFRKKRRLLRPPELLLFSMINSISCVKHEKNYLSIKAAPEKTSRLELIISFLKKFKELLLSVD